MSSTPLNLLLNATEHAIEAAWCNVSVYTHHGEPAHVARLVTHLPQQLVAAWAGAALPQGGLTVTGVFCHHRPKVRWKPATPMTQRSYGPELADLLLIVESPNAPASQQYLALLIQAKMGNLDGSFLVTRGSELAQRYMYANWPAFEFAALPVKRRLQGQRFQIGGRSGSGTRYAAIQALKRKPPTWRLESAEASFPQESGSLTFAKFQNPSYPYMAASSLADVLVGMCSGQGMHPARAFDPGATDDWTLVIEYLQEFAWQMQSRQHPLPSTRGATTKNHVPSWVNSACLFGAPPVPGAAWNATPSARAMARSYRTAHELPGVGPGGVFGHGASVHFNTPHPDGEPPSRGFGVLMITLDEPLRLREE